MGFLSPVYSRISIETKIVSLSGKYGSEENPFSGMFYAVFLKLYSMLSKLLTYLLFLRIDRETKKNNYRPINTIFVNM